MEDNPSVRKPPEKRTLCHMISLVRSFHWTVGGTADDLVPPSCATVLGWAEVPEFVADGTMRIVIWLEKKDDAGACERVIQRIPAGTYRAFLLAPTAYDPSIPDIVLISANAAQMSLPDQRYPV